MSQLGTNETIRKEKLCKIIPEGETFTTCLVRRRKSKSGKARYYIYNSDDQLEIAAECEIYKDCYFTISLESIEFNKESPFVIARLVNRRYENYYYSEILQDGIFKKNMTIKYLSHYAKKNRQRRIQIEFEPNFGTQEMLIQSEYFNESIQKAFPDICDKMKRSSKNFFISLANGKHCFSLTKIYKDEFHLAISYPLSILEGFIIALSTFHILKNE